MYFFVHIGGGVQPEMVVKLPRGAGNGRDLLKAQIIRVRLLERKYHVHKILTQLRDVGNALMRRSQTNHSFGRV